MLLLYVYLEMSFHVPRQELTLGPRFAVFNVNTECKHQDMVYIHKGYHVWNEHYRLQGCDLFCYLKWHLFFWFFFLVLMAVCRDSFTLFDIFLILVKCSESEQLGVPTWAGLPLTHTLAVQNKSPFSFTADHEVNTWAV